MEDLGSGCLLDLSSLWPDAANPLFPRSCGRAPTWLPSAATRCWAAPRPVLSRGVGAIIEQVKRNPMNRALQDRQIYPGRTRERPPAVSGRGNGHCENSHPGHDHPAAAGDRKKGGTAAPQDCPPAGRPVHGGKTPGRFPGRRRFAARTGIAELGGLPAAGRHEGERPGREAARACRCRSSAGSNRTVLSSICAACRMTRFRALAAALYEVFGAEPGPDGKN